MAPSRCIELSERQQDQLLGIARQAIQCQLSGLARPAPDCLAQQLEARLGTFVTLTRAAALRGCIGTLHGTLPLHLAVADAARSAARSDPRFPPLQAHELAGIQIEIAVLSPLQPLPAVSRELLLASLRPGIDGLLLEDQGRRSTFLPKVWEQLPDPEEFFAQLLAKAGLPPGHWSGTLRLQRYQALSFREH
jgi:hypothetical protein